MAMTKMGVSDMKYSVAVLHKRSAGAPSSPVFSIDPNTSTFGILTHSLHAQEPMLAAKPSPAIQKRARLNRTVSLRRKA